MKTSEELLKVMKLGKGKINVYTKSGEINVHFEIYLIHIILKFTLKEIYLGCFTIKFQTTISFYIERVSPPKIDSNVYIVVLK